MTNEEIECEIRRATDRDVVSEFRFASGDAEEADLRVVLARYGKPRQWRFDYAIPSVRIAVEIEGGVWVQGRHNRGKGFTEDIEKYNTATALGWRVLRSTRTRAQLMRTLDALKIAESLTIT